MRLLRRNPSPAIFALMLALLSGCSTCNNAKEIKVYVDPELKSWFNYKSMSYWILRDASTSEFDSMICRGWGNTVFAGNDDFQYESLSVDFLEYRKAATKHHGGFIIGMQVLPGRNTSHVRYFDSTNKGVNYDPFMSVPYVTNGSSLGYGAVGRRDQAVNISFHPQLPINNRMFDSVYQLTYTFPGSSAVEQFYMNRKIGFLKIVQDNPVVKRTLELERWDVTHQ